jgi:hypothetical protein
MFGKLGPVDVSALQRTGVLLSTVTFGVGFIVRQVQIYPA